MKKRLVLLIPLLALLVTMGAAFAAETIINASNPGGKVNIPANLVKDKINIVEFYADW